MDKATAAAEPKTWPCTCHPDDHPPVPCPQKFALTDCRKHVARKHLRELFDAAPWLGEQQTPISGCLNVTWHDLWVMSDPFGSP
jgi:hypothetical protein